MLSEINSDDPTEPQRPTETQQKPPRSTFLDGHVLTADSNVWVPKNHFRVFRPNLGSSENDVYIVRSIQCTRPFLQQLRGPNDPNGKFSNELMPGEGARLDLD